MIHDLAQNSFLYSGNATYITELLRRYLKDKNSVDDSWQSFFASLPQESLDELKGASWSRHDGFVISPKVAPKVDDQAKEPMKVSQTTVDSIRALMLIRAYRVRGHLMAQIDPLGLDQCTKTSHPELDPTAFGFGPNDLDRPIFLNYTLGLEQATLRQILNHLKKTYCHHIGVEFMHIQDPEQKSWIQERIEKDVSQAKLPFTPTHQRDILKGLTEAETFEQYLHRKYPGTKRFGLDGGEILIPVLEQLVTRGSELGIIEVVIGMAHRGRLNVLTNFMKKPFVALFHEFQGLPSQVHDAEQDSGDVKYHLGRSTDRFFNEKKVHLSVIANPSHLEAVNPVVLGKVRAKQQQYNDHNRQKVLGLLLHGDAAFAGQGLVSEILALSNLQGYNTGGTVHLIINNQIGFTTIPAYARSGSYASDAALMIQAPIFHVNGDDPEAVVYIARLAIEFRQTFNQDVVIDIVCYRRYGHNESDEPAFTQPLMYQEIERHPTTRELYIQKLLQEEIITETESTNDHDYLTKQLDEAFSASKSYELEQPEWLRGVWDGFVTSRSDEEPLIHTAVDEEQLIKVGKALWKIPDSSFNLNTKIIRQLKAKEMVIQEGTGIDWATAEALAFGTLLLERTPVRLSGQDSGRGTFSQRHAILYDQITEERYIPFNHLDPSQETFLEVHNSPLSEAGVLGFEYGYSLADPNTLVLWEAQFGDFVNGAQVIIDQFICSAEYKWQRLSGLVMLLPHGYEGQGPEHSSARPERFLQLCAETNMRVVNCTTPANYFHALRRQIRSPIRKPLIIFTPKSLLRNKVCVSTLTDMSGTTSFARILGDPIITNKHVHRVILCSGKVYYDLLAERSKQTIEDIAIIRIEQLYPFPFTALSKELQKHYPKATDIVWCQEEPMNMGAWSFIDRRVESILTELDLPAKRPRYIGRPASASPATGSSKRHHEEQTTLINKALQPM